MVDLLSQGAEHGQKPRRWQPFAGLLLAAGLALLLTSCVSAPKPVLPLLGEQELLQRLQDNAGAFYSMRGITRIRAKNGNDSASARQVLLLAKPDRLRAEVLNPFGQPLFLLAVRDGKLSVLVPGEQRFLQGEATAERIARFIRLPLSPEQMVRLALYDLPLISYGETSLSFDEAGYLLLLSGGELGQKLKFDTSGRLLGSAYYRGEQVLLEVAYKDFDAELGEFPRQMTVTMPEQSTSFSLSYNDIELNPQLTAERFTLSPPSGVVVEALP